MSTRELAELACKIIAVALLAFTIVEIATVLAAMFYPLLSQVGSLSDFSPVAFLVGTFFLAIPLGLRLGTVWFLWAKADWISRQMVPYSESKSRWPRLRAADLQVAGFACIVLFFFCNGVRELGQFITLVVRHNMEGFNYGDLFVSDLFVGLIANLAIGIWLLLSSRGVVGFIHRLRRSDAVSDESQDTDGGVTAEMPPA